MNILLTGGTGFVGQSLIKDFGEHHPSWKIFAISRTDNNPDVKNLVWITRFQDFGQIIHDNAINTVIHLAGKAHDTKNTSKAEEYYEVNYELTKKLFNAFAESSASKFVFLSTIKAVGDDKTYVSNALDLSEPQTPYAKSKREAEKYIQSYKLGPFKQFYVLRPTLIYGPNVKGNLSTLVKFACKGLPYPFEAFENKRSYLSINNLCFILGKLIEEDYRSMTLNIANEDTISTSELMLSICKALNTKPSKIKIPEILVQLIAKAGDYLPIPLNSEKLNKITGSFVVDTAEMVKVLGFNLPEKTYDTISIIVQRTKS